MHALFRRLAIGAAVSAIAIASPTVAQTATFNVPSQEVTSAVRQLARQAKIQIVVSGRVARDRRTRAIAGAMSVDQALQRMLAGTGLSAKKEASGAWAVIAEKAANRPDLRAPGHANDAPHDPAEAAAQRPDPRSIGSEDIVVTGYTSPFRSKENASTVVESVVFDPLESPARDGSIAGMLSNLPGLSAVEDGDEPRYIVIRGITTDYNLTSIDGLRLASLGENGVSTTGRRTNLQVLPSDMTARVDVYKTFTAEQEADNIGGAINMVTLSAFDPHKRSLFLDLRGQYNTFANDSSNSLDKKSGHFGWSANGRYLTNFGSDGQFGLVLSGRYSRSPRNFDNNLDGTGKNYYSTTGTKLTSPDASKGWDGKVFPVSNPCFCSYNDLIDRFGGSAKLEFRSPSGAFQASILGYDYVQVQDLNANVNYINLTVTKPPAATATGYSYPIASYLWGYWHDTFRRENRGVLANASYDVGERSQFTWRAGLTRDGFDDYQPRVHLQASPKGQFYNFNLVGGGQQSVLTSITDPTTLYNTQYKIASQYETTQHATQRVFDTRLDFSHNVGRGAQGFGFVIGAEYSHLNQANDTEATYYTLTPTTYANDAIVDPGYAPMGSPYSLGRIDIKKYLGEYWGRFPVNAASTYSNSLDSDLGYSEDLKTAYLSAHYKLGQASIVAGVRYDAASYTTRSPEQVGGVFTGAFTSLQGKYHNWLPSVNITQRLGARGNTLLRASYSNTLSRPAPASMAAAVTTSCADDGECTITRGNPNLKPRKSRNLDVSIEHYYAGPKGMLELTYFNKTIKNNFFTLSETAIVDGTTYTYRQPMNAGRSSLNGIEAAWVHRGLPVGISNHQIDLSANASRLWGRMDYVTATSAVSIDRLGYQPEWIVNASATYRVPKIGGGLRVNLNYRGDNLTKYSATPYTFDYRGSLTSLNISAWHKVYRGLVFKYEANNVTNGQPGHTGGQGINYWTQSPYFGRALYFHAVVQL